jgi:peptidoglycan hydrolase-like protein with peptidoglycan-binding domain
VIFAALGLKSFSVKYTYIIIAAAVVLLGLNSYFLNANRLTNQDPMASTYYNELMSLPNNSIVVTEPGQYSLGLFYAMSNGKQLIPLIYPYIDIWNFKDYSEWLVATYPVTVGSTTVATIQDNLNAHQIYYVGLPDPNDKFLPHLVLEGTGLIRQIEGVK